MDEQLYNATNYSKVLQAKKVAEGYIGELYSSFENLTFEKKVKATVEIDLLRDIIFELDKYIINYQERNKNGAFVSDYVVMEGDTLPGIASRIYKTPTKWVDIFMYNELSDTLLETGTILKIPRG